MIPLFPALSLPDSRTLYRISNAVLAVADLRPPELSVAEGDDFVPHPELSNGFFDGTRSAISKIVGRYPDSLWMDHWSVGSDGYLETYLAAVYRFKGTRWQKVDAALPDHEYLALWEAPEGCLLGLVSNGHPHAGHVTAAAKVRVVDCKGQNPLLPSVPKWRGSGAGRLIIDVVGTRTGDLYFIDKEDTRVYGQPPKYSPLLLEIWRHGEAVPITSTIPVPPEVPQSAYTAGIDLFVSGAQDVYVAMCFRGHWPDRAPDQDGPPIKSVILRFDGTTWSPIESPPVPVYTEIVMADDGTIALRHEGWRKGEVSALTVKRPGQGWSMLGPLPRAPGGEETVPKQIIARSADDIWVLGWAPKVGNTLFFTRPAATGPKSTN